MTSVNRQWRLARRPQGGAQTGNLTFTEGPDLRPGPGAFLVRVWPEPAQP